jgi:hypothetical protein
VYQLLRFAITSATSPARITNLRSKGKVYDRLEIRVHGHGRTEVPFGLDICNVMGK